MPLSRRICALLLDHMQDLRRLICMASPTAGKAVMHAFEERFAAHVSCTAYSILGCSFLYRAAPSAVVAARLD